MPALEQIPKSHHFENQKHEQRDIRAALITKLALKVIEGEEYNGVFCF